jgi:hypothetical protein
VLSNTSKTWYGLLGVVILGGSEMNEPQFIIEEITDPAEVARAKAQHERYKRNSDWLQAHWADLLPQARGKFLVVAGQEAFLADTPDQAWAWAERVHPEDHGALVQYVRTYQGPRIYANRLAHWPASRSGSRPLRARRRCLTASILPRIIKDMNADRLRDLLNVRPFEPLEVELSSGQVFAIKHPENVIVLKNTLVVADPETDSVQWTSLIHVVAVRRRQLSLPESA